MSGFPGQGSYEMSSAGEAEPSRTALTDHFATQDTPSESIPADRRPPGKIVNPGDGRASRIWGAVTVLTLFLLGWCVYYGLSRGGRQVEVNDFYIHVATVLHKDVVRDAHRIAYPLFHWTLALVLAFFPEQGWPSARLSAVGVLAFALALRGWLSYREVRGTMPAMKAALVCVLLALVLALPNWWRKPSALPDGVGPSGWWMDLPSVYLGVVNPNVWHNPTTIFAAPFAFLLFHQAVLYLETPGIQLAFSVGIASVLCALAKPNYLLAFLPVFGLVMFAEAYRSIRWNRLSRGRAVLYAVTAFSLPVAALVGQYVYTFATGAKNGVMFKPWAIWSIFVDPPEDPDILYQIRPLVLLSRIPFAILLGVAFPVVVAICYPRELWRDRRTSLAWMILGMAIAEYALLAETYQPLSGNFFWALVPACYILFVMSCRLIGGQSRGWRSVLCFIVLGLHAVSGVIYVARALIDPAHVLQF
jgi:hypothetical protein